MKNKIFAIPADAPAIPPNPKAAATRATIKKTRAQYCLSRKPKHAKAFYSILSAATALGMGITLTPLDPIKALYWSAVINGVVAVPVMSVMMIITAQRKIMKKFIIGGWLRWLGWASTAAMGVSVVGMVVGWLS